MLYLEWVCPLVGGDAGNQVGAALQGSDVKPNENLVADISGSDPTSDFTYRYKYYE
ncbi:unnamed protein product [marine sediment metagenome]|uniref:Uncharacterized protein n=1 Tax=marine sediment metagenome TaxID=412755 RepID=X1SIY1_9ZZZZ